MSITTRARHAASGRPLGSASMDHRVLAGESPVDEEVPDAVDRTLAGLLTDEVGNYQARGTCPHRRNGSCLFPLSLEHGASCLPRRTLERYTVAKIKPSVPDSRWLIRPDRP